jgi:hypothetical protein
MQDILLNAEELVQVQRILIPEEDLGLKDLRILEKKKVKHLENLQI